MKPADRAELDAYAAQGCVTAGCKHDTHAEGLFLSPKCHPSKGVFVVYNKGNLEIVCAVCKTPILAARVAAGNENQIRDDILALFGRQEPGGKPCWPARVEFVAFLCHCLGIRGHRLHREVAGVIGAYDKTCADPSCKHEVQ